MSDSIRAVRNNNPGNIERGEPWQGLMPLADMSDEQRNETRFCVFKSPKWGFRALARVLISYQDKYDIRTIERAIGRWAPAAENDTRAYIRAVSGDTHRIANETLDFHTWADLAPVVKAIATHECGGWMFDDRDLEAGLRLAGVEAPAKALTSSRTIKTATIATTATGLSLMAETVQQIAPATSFIKEVSVYAPWAAGVLVMCLLGAIIYYRYDDWQRAAR